MNPKDIQMLSTTSLLTESGIIYFDQRLLIAFSLHNEIRNCPKELFALESDTVDVSSSVQTDEPISSLAVTSPRSTWMPNSPDHGADAH